MRQMRPCVRSSRSTSPRRDPCCGSCANVCRQSLAWVAFVANAPTMLGAMGRASAMRSYSFLLWVEFAANAPPMPGAMGRASAMRAYSFLFRAAFSANAPPMLGAVGRASAMRSYYWSRLPQTLLLCLMLWVAPRRCAPPRLRWIRKD